MRRTTWVPTRWMFLVLMLLTCCTSLAFAQAGQAPASGQNPAVQRPKPKGPPGPNDIAGQYYENIKLLKDVPATQIIPLMHLMEVSLGVDCAFCHDMKTRDFAADTKEEKAIARQMIQMTFDINKSMFKGMPQVTCNTCHRGHDEPPGNPSIDQVAAMAAAQKPPEAKPTLPKASEIIDKYIAALGGRAALEQVNSRIAKGTLYRMKVENPGTMQQKAIARGEQVPIEVDQKGPNKMVIKVTGPKGVTEQVYDGSQAWQIGGGGKHEIAGAEAGRLSIFAALHPALAMAERANKMRVRTIDKVGDHEVYVLQDVAEDGRRERLFFDTHDGLLVRRILYTTTVLGSDPEQLDYSDYRDVGGTKLPFTIKDSFIDDAHLGTTRVYTDIKNNAPVPDAAFSGGGAN